MCSFLKRVVCIAASVATAVVADKINLKKTNNMYRKSLLALLMAIFLYDTCVFQKKVVSLQRNYIR